MIIESGSKVLARLRSGKEWWPTRPTRTSFILALVSSLVPASAWACVFTPPYRLPVPFAMYAWGSSSALCLSFVIMAVLARAPSLGWTSGANRAAAQIVSVGSDRPIWHVGQILSVALLILCIATGLYGTQDQFANFNMTFFWVIFVLAVPYTTLLVGDFYKSINPWKSIVSWSGALGSGGFAGVARYPQGLGYYPALVLYMAFIWLELFGQHTPRELSLALLGYSIVTVAGAWLFGYRDWFQYGEFFGVFLRLIGYVAPLSSSSGKWRWRMPFSGLLEEETEHISLLLFILFMLSSTAYDGLHETRGWVVTFWKGIYPHVSPFLSDSPRVAYTQALMLDNLWLWFWLVASPFVYLAVFQFFVWIAKVITRSKYSVRELSLRFALSLVPIAIVFHMTHYYPTVLSQGVEIVRLISDPFGLGWNVFGTANLAVAPIMVNVALLWKTQVVLIVVGHIIACYLAHTEAIRVFPSTRQATLSQVPLLLLMVIFTTVGLKILSMPFAPGQ
jgi:hypothetical protein